MKIKYTREQIEAIMKEVGRRINILLNNGEIETMEELHDFRADMMQGVFSVICATADRDDLFGYWDMIDEIWDSEIKAGNTAWMGGRW